MPQGGTLTCATIYHSDSRQVEVRVADTGSGVSVENQSHLFEPFFTTRPDGTGLGLALCQEIVTNHGGTIDFLAEEKSGSTFRFVLPIQAD